MGGVPISGQVSLCPTPQTHMPTQYFKIKQVSGMWVTNDSPEEKNQGEEVSKGHCVSWSMYLGRDKRKLSTSFYKLLCIRVTLTASEASLGGIIKNSV